MKKKNGREKSRFIGPCPQCHTRFYCSAKPNPERKIFFNRFPLRTPIGKDLIYSIAIAFRRKHFIAGTTK